MKEMFRSFRIFTGNYSIKNVLSSGIAFVVVFGAMSLLTMIEAPEDSFLEGFVTAFVPAFSLFAPLLGAFLLNAVYLYNLPITAGYKYFHSMRDGGKRYVQAIIAANILTVFIAAFAVGIQAIIFSIVGSEAPYLYIMSVVIAMIVTGLINLIGNTRRQWLRMVTIMPVFVLSGGLFGYTAAIVEDGERIPNIIMWIALAVAAVVYVAGLIYTLAVSAKKWRMSE